MKRLFELVSRGLMRFEEACLAWAIIGIAVLTILNVAGRTLGHSLAFAEELSRFLIIVVTFVGLGYAAGQARHIRMTALYDQLPERPRKALAMTISATTALLLLVLTWLALDYVLGTVRPLGSVSPVLGVPLWLVYLAAPFGLILAAVQYLLAFGKNLTTSGVWLSFERGDGYLDEPPPSEL